MVPPWVQTPLVSSGPGPRAVIGEETIDIDKRPGQSSVVFDMPNKDPETARRLKHEWYMRNREELLKRKREQRARQKKLKPPRPPKPAPTPEQKAKARALNKEACDRYRASRLSQVRAINRDYYHRHRERIVQQQRDRRALAKQKKQNLFRQLRALADVCTVRFIELDHGYAKAAEEEAGPRAK